MDKFNDYDKLLRSYNELEKRFTKKCQELASLKKDGTSEVTPPSASETFFRSYPEAERFKEEIVAQANSPAYAGREDAYVRAYFDLLRKNSASPKAAEDFLQRRVPSNDAATPQKAPAPDLPKVISGKGGAMSVVLPTRPRTIEEASRLATEYFK